MAKGALDKSKTLFWMGSKERGW